MGQFQTWRIPCLNGVDRDPDVHLFLPLTSSAILTGSGWSATADFPHGPQRAAAVLGVTGRGNVPGRNP